ncbi:MAG: hypothetical protein D6820_10625 [Lentisphaerae bacterium]|nr:MAG: hypothetical protein D6820_10625 [Lentisphaerota bacterium]
MEKITHNTVLGIIIAVTLLGTIALSVFIYMSGNALKKQFAELASVKHSKEQIQNSKYLLSKENVARARQNAELLWKKYNDAYDKLTQKYKVVAVREETFKDRTPAAMKLTISSEIRSRQDMLLAAMITVDPSAKYLTFGDILSTDAIPDAKKIPLYMRNLYIVSELVRIITESRVKALNAFRGNGPDADLQKSENGKYRYLTYQITVTGTYGSIQRLINNILNAKYLFILRNLKFEIEDVAQSLKSGSLATNPERPAGPYGLPPGNRNPQVPARNTRMQAALNPASKAARILFPRMSTVKVELTLDYVELIRQKAMLTHKRRR